MWSNFLVKFKKGNMVNLTHVLHPIKKIELTDFLKHRKSSFFSLINVTEGSTQLDVIHFGQPFLWATGLQLATIPHLNLFLRVQIMHNLFKSLWKYDSESHNLSFHFETVVIPMSLSCRRVIREGRCMYTSWFIWRDVYTLRAKVGWGIWRDIWVHTQGIHCFWWLFSGITPSVPNYTTFWSFHTN